MGEVFRRGPAEDYFTADEERLDQEGESRAGKKKARGGREEAGRSPGRLTGRRGGFRKDPLLLVRKESTRERGGVRMLERQV